MTETRLDQLVCFALYSASRAVINAYRPLLDEVGLTYPQYLVLLVLWEQGPQPVKALGAALQLDSGTLSPMLKRLETAGLVRRERRPGDERSVLITLTPAGADLETRARDIPVRTARAAGLSASELDRLRTSLTTFTAAVSGGMPSTAAATSGRRTRGES
ncbi:MAG: MarR family transcriptional regulator [Actinobacteria bacterium 13_2_20CM_2_71_6]|nr:MAG: MarR family transcriptional regulator [Actinobacteria bacterium 13_2_20CM_2_71_6]